MRAIPRYTVDLQFGDNSSLLATAGGKSYIVTVSLPVRLSVGSDVTYFYALIVR